MFKILKGRLSTLFNSVKKRDYPKKTIIFIRKRPMTAFLLTLGLLLLLIILGNLLRPPVKETPQPDIVKDVTVLTLGKTSSVKVAAHVKKYGVLQISAQSSGVVSAVKVTEGQSVAKGKNLISLSTNYQGGNASSISRQIAQKQYENTRDSFDSQKEIIQKQKDLALQNANNTEDLRNISVKSNEDTKSLLDLNKDMLSSINLTLDDLIANNTGGVNDQLILQTKQTKAGLQASVNSLQSQVRSLDFSTDTSKAPTQIANLNKDITLKQLDLQEKTLILNKEVSKLQLSLAAVTEALMFPVSPCSGVIQKVHVGKGELVSPGSPLVNLSCDDRSVKIIAQVPAEIAETTSDLMESTIKVKDQNFSLLPDFISTEATDGQLYQIVFTISEDFPYELTDGSFIDIFLPIGQLNSKTQFFVPLDSVSQTQDSAFVYVVENNQAVSKKVILGEVLGSDVEITEGLNLSDKIILNRNVVADDKVKIINE